MYVRSCSMSHTIPTGIPNVNTYGLFTYGYSASDNPGMDKYEIRRERVERLIKDRCDGVYAKFADKIERSPSYVGRMLYPEGKPGKKNISDTLIDVIEQKFDLPRGWLDGIELGTGKQQELKEETLTGEQKQILSLAEGIRKEARDAWLKVGSYLAGEMPERRKEDIENHQNRRAGDTPPDPHDLRNYNPKFDDDDDEQSEERITK